MFFDFIPRILFNFSASLNLNEIHMAGITLTLSWCENKVRLKIIRVKFLLSLYLEFGLVKFRMEYAQVKVVCKERLLSTYYVLSF